MYKVIGIAGPAHSGKDTAADYLVENLSGSNYKFPFAYTLKEMARVLGLKQEQLYGNMKDEMDDVFQCTPRKILQTLGTDWGRNIIHPDLWVMAMQARLNTTPANTRLIIPDVRFENEAAFVRQNGVLIHITGRFDTVSNVEEHVSEAGLEVVAGRDLLINNSGGITDYKIQLINLLGIFIMREERGEKE